MTETLLSPGVLARENDQSFVSQGPIQAGAAVVGPAVKGPVGIPTLVTTYSDYVNKFGGSFLSGGVLYSYFTSIAANNYFNNGGTSLLVTRVTPQTFTSAVSTPISNNLVSVSGNYATASFQFTTAAQTGSGVAIGFQVANNTYWLAGYNIDYSDPDLDYAYFNVNGTFSYTLNEWGTALATAINTFETKNYISASWNTNTLSLSGSISGEAGNGIQLYTQGEPGLPIQYMTLAATLGGGTPNINTEAFVLETLSQGEVMNSSGSIGANGLLVNGTGDNLKYQIVSPVSSSGTFTLLIRQGNDTDINPVVLETWSNISLDPYAPNYIESTIGNQSFSVQTDSSTGTTYIQTTGQYINSSRYVRVKQVNFPTPNYLNNNGGIGTGSYASGSSTATTSYANFLPVASTGSFRNAVGSLWISGSSPAMYQNATTATNIQGLNASRYTQSLNLLSNADDYKFNIITIPGVTQEQGGVSATVINQTATLCQNRGDAIAVVDVANYNANIGTVTNQASGFDNSYTATYWPWLQTVDPGTGQRVWVPASTMIPGVYAFTDSVAEPWFAPAGINRGGLGLVIQAERRLSQTDRDTLYQNRVNPIATFPGTGVVVYGQKTLQKKASALDRVNVRRLLIALKSYISQVALNLVFEQNSATTRLNFLNQVNPYLESVQQRQGLFAFQVVMDDSNNTPDVIDRNQLVGQIYLQPTKTAEFILLDFNILPTGATFG